ncbi:MAG: Stf0 family sulfotransferase [Pseudomonadota bacterium]
MICTSPRCGSTLLCEMLKATGVAGAPASLFYDQTVREWAAYFGLPADAPDAALFPRVLDAAQKKGSAGGPIFAVRQQRTSFNAVSTAFAAAYPHLTTDLARFEAAFGPMHFIYLTRADKVAQAVSYLRAQETGLWHRATDGSDFERNPPRRAPGYDHAALEALVARFTAFDKAWQTWFQTEGITPHIITYDKLAADALGTLRRTLTALDLDVAMADHVDIPVQKLSDATNADWIARYRRHLT